VLCTRGLRDPSAGSGTDGRWWYLSVPGAAPVRLLRVTPGESRRDVWETALTHLDRMADLRP
jgi:hypothetical protein